MSNHYLICSTPLDKGGRGGVGKIQVNKSNSIICVILHKLTFFAFEKIFKFKGNTGLKAVFLTKPLVPKN